MPGSKTYEDWIVTHGIPIYRDLYAADLRTIELAWWETRKCNAAYLQLVGQAGAVEARVIEIAPAETLPAWKMGVDEIVYVVEGNGVSAVWSKEGQRPHSFEWKKHSMFVIPHNSWHQVTNMRGDQPARLLFYNSLPIAVSAAPDPEFFIDNPYENDAVTDGGESLYSEAVAVPMTDARIVTGGQAVAWTGNYFPDLQVWDRLSPNKGRGAGGHSVRLRFPKSEMQCHMSVFAPQTYKKAHRHGPGFLIIIPAGEGYSIMWQEGEEKHVIPWHEASVFVPPDRWFHQHFNVGGEAARYLAFHPPLIIPGISERLEDQKRDQIEYPAEEPWIRQMFEEEMAKRGLKSLMPDEAYSNAEYQWAYA